jgi:BMFP domain-containing protein YqiC
MNILSKPEIKNICGGSIFNDVANNVVKQAKKKAQELADEVNKKILEEEKAALAKLIGK